MYKKKAKTPKPRRFIGGCPITNKHLKKHFFNYKKK